MEPIMPPPQPGTPVVAPEPPAPAPTPEPTPPASFEDGGDTDKPFMEKIFGASNGELGFTGIFVLGLMVTGFVYQIVYYRRQITAGSSHASLQKQIDDLKSKLSAAS